MCINAKVSLSTWALALVASVYVFTSNSNSVTKWIALFLLAFTFIQFLEGMIWRNYEDKKKKELLTKLLLIALMIQPVVNSYMGYKATGENTLKYMSIIYGVILLATIVYVATSDSYFTSIRGPNKHLMWLQDGKTLFDNKTLLGIVYAAGIFIPLLYMPGKLKYIFLSIASISALYSYNNYNKTREFSSMWCYISALVASVVVMITANRK